MNIVLVWFKAWTILYLFYFIIYLLLSVWLRVCTYLGLNVSVS